MGASRYLRERELTAHLKHILEEVCSVPRNESGRLARNISNSLLPSPDGSVNLAKMSELIHTEQLSPSLLLNLSAALGNKHLFNFALSPEMQNQLTNNVNKVANLSENQINNHLSNLLDNFAEKLQLTPQAKEAWKNEIMEGLELDQKQNLLSLTPDMQKNILSLELPQMQSLLQESPEDLYKLDGLINKAAQEFIKIAPFLGVTVNNKDETQNTLAQILYGLTANQPGAAPALVQQINPLATATAVQDHVNEEGTEPIQVKELASMMILLLGEYPEVEEQLIAELQFIVENGLGNNVSVQDPDQDDNLQQVMAKPPAPHPKHG